jgi:hypothetical protein
MRWRMCIFNTSCMDCSIWAIHRSIGDPVILGRYELFVVTLGIFDSSHFEW